MEKRHINKYKCYRSGCP